MTLLVSQKKVLGDSPVVPLSDSYVSYINEM